MKLTQILLILSTGVLAGACASVSAPVGGPKDETPPTLIRSNPKNQELNVRTKTVTLTFDEEVQENKLSSELIITPNTDNKYKVRSNKEVFSLEFEKPLLENTTYTFNFREGITDITEKNKAPNLKLSFSTGTFIDSSKVTGTVKDLLTQKPQKDIIVGLYPTNDTLTVRKNKPYYQTATNSEGKYELTNVKEGEYRIYAVADKNKNSFYDNEDEKIAYLASPIKITAKTEPVILELTKIDTKRPILLKRENYSDRFTANYNEGLRSFEAVYTQAKNGKLNYKISQDGKAVDLFKTKEYKGGKTILTAVDSAGNISTDTIDIKFEGKRPQLIKGANLKVINRLNTQTITPGSTVTLELETPVTIVGKEPISILSDSIVIKKLKFPEEITQDPTQTELKFKLPNINGKNKKISIQLDSTGIKPLEGTALKFTPIPLAIAENGGTGNVKGIVSTKYNSYTIQLLNKDFNVVEEVKNVKTFEFRNITPGSYTIRVLVDENNNGVWEAADPEFNRKPEKVYIYNKTLDVRANWELEGEKLEF